MAKLFIYYSFSGNGDAVANKLKEKDFELRKVETSFKLSKRIFPQMVKGGFSAGINQHPKLINYDNNIDNYDEIYIGSPIWNSRFASPVNTVLRDTELDGKKVTFVLYSGSGTGKKADKKINKYYPNAKIIHLKQPKDIKEELAKLD